jgi:hypothetical protein
MEPLNPSENDLIVKLIRVGNHLEGDATAERIQWLTSGILEKIAFSRENGAWETLFKDKNDGRYWERTYPHGEMHGGGSPRLTCISEVEAREKYKF